MLELAFYQLVLDLVALMRPCARCEASWCGSECEEHREES